MNWIDHQFEDLATCPWCGWKDSDSWEYEEDGAEGVECPRCEKLFDVDVNITWTYSTSKSEEE